MSTQTRIRRGTASQIDSMTPAADEIISDTTNKRLRKGDGLTPGGIHLPNYQDNRTLVFNRGTIGGTPNAITLTISPVPTGSFTYLPYMSFSFIAISTNTSAVTIDINSSGSAKTIKKISGGVLTDLVAGDLVAGGFYEIAYDGTYFQLKNILPAGLVSIGQGDLRTSIGSVARALNTTGGQIFSLPGGEYGFYPQIRFNTSSSSQGSAQICFAQSGAGLGTSFNTLIYLSCNSVGNNVNGMAIVAQQRYVTASPPFDMGDGEAGGFIYALVNENSGQITAHYAADVPPWAYNGPTNIRSDYMCRATGRKFRTKKPKDLDSFLNKRGSFKEGELEEITMEMKNADMNLIPHPFGEIPEGEKIILIDPMDVKVRNLIDYQNMGGTDEVVEKLTKGYITLDNSACKRCGPKGVAIHKMKYKYTKK